MEPDPRTQWLGQVPVVRRTPQILVMVLTPTGALMYKCLATEAHRVKYQSSSYGANSLATLVLTMSAHSGTLTFPDFLRKAERATTNFCWSTSFTLTGAIFPMLRIKEPH